MKIRAVLFVFVFFFLSCGFLLQAQESFKAGDRVEVDINMASTPDYANWKPGTIKLVDLSVGGYWIQRDDGVESLIPKRDPEKWIRRGPSSAPSPRTPAPAPVPAPSPSAPAPPMPLPPAPPSDDDPLPPPGGTMPAPSPYPSPTPTPNPGSTPSPTPAQPGAGELPGAGTPPAAHQVTANGPVGLFFMTRFSGFSGSLEKAVWYFSPEGYAFENPASGFSHDALSATSQRYGQFRVQGDQLIVQLMAGGTPGTEKPGRYEVKDGGQAFNWDLGIFTRVQPFAPGQNIAGTWQGGFSGAARTLQLNPDGTFSLSGASSVTTESSASSVTVGGYGPINNGRWSLSGYFMTLSGANGTRTGIAFPRDEPDTTQNPDSFYFDGITWTPVR